jgi:hypothetical protein
METLHFLKLFLTYRTIFFLVAVAMGSSQDISVKNSLKTSCSKKIKLIVCNRGRIPQTLLRGRLHVSESVYESPYDSVHDLLPKDLGF